MNKLIPSALSLLVFTTGCLDNQLEPGSEDGEVAAKRTFIAQQSDFADYADWMTAEMDVQDDHGGVIGKTTVYVSERPDPDTHQFAIGAMLVKTMIPSGEGEAIVHAMTKRGSAFNREGAIGWEYFELLLDKKNVPFIMWRGSAPPTGEQYKVLLGANNRAQTGLDGDCNSCHAEGRDGLLGDDVLALLDDES